MTTLAQLRKAALSHPETTEQADGPETAAFTVRDRRFATAAPGEVGDLPKAIGAPATRALTRAGITTLAQAAALTDAELLALQGVGPRAVRILRETLTPGIEPNTKS